MSAATAQNDLVPLSHGLGAGTVGQSPISGTARGTSHGTASLKALANKVLQRSKVGQAMGQTVGQRQKSCPTLLTPVGQKKGAVPPPVPADFSTGLEWIVWPADDTDLDDDAKWAAVDLRDIGRHYGVRVVRSAERILAIFPPDLDAELVAATSEALVVARPYLAADLDKLPILTPANAVEIILDVMRAHKGLRFCRGDGGSRWPIYPREWTAGQKATLQSLWLLAGDALDLESFKEIDQ